MNFLSETISIKEAVSPDLALRNSAQNFFKRIERLENNKIVVDFTDVKTITRSFADEYLNHKKSSKKEIIDVNVPENVAKMFAVVKKKPEKFAVPKSKQKKDLFLKITA
ncbi:MAG: DUF4325 domain-containing protein [Candidatus Bathyarchaeota archaeon]|nr:DUF4325 domain-containing protein [Candidatus Bathyarchaeum tardum]